MGGRMQRSLSFIVSSCARCGEIFRKTVWLNQKLMSPETIRFFEISEFEKYFDDRLDDTENFILSRIMNLGAIDIASLAMLIRSSTVYRLT
jgi:hypothetical protein